MANPLPATPAATLLGSFAFAFDEESFSDRKLHIVIEEPDDDVEDEHDDDEEEEEDDDDKDNNEDSDDEPVSKRLRNKSGESNFAAASSQQVEQEQEQDEDEEEQAASSSTGSKRARGRNSVLSKKENKKAASSSASSSSAVEEGSEVASPAIQLPIYKTIACTALVLARASPFFRTLLGGAHGMKESGEKEVRVTVNSAEEAEALYAALKVLYFESFSAAELPADTDPLEVLRIADRFEMPAVVTLASCAMVESGLSVAGAVAVLGLPDSISSGAEMGPIITAATQTLMHEFRNLKDRWQSDEWLELTPDALLAVLTSEELEAPSENTVFCAVHRWLECSPHVPGKMTFGQPYGPKQEFMEKLLTTDGALRLARLRYPFLMYIAQHIFPGKNQKYKRYKKMLKRQQDRTWLQWDRGEIGLELAQEVDDRVEALESFEERYASRIRDAIIFASCDSHTRSRLFGGSSRNLLKRPGYERVPCIKHVPFEISLSDPVYSTTGSRVESDKQFLDGHYFYLSTKKHVQPSAEHGADNEPILTLSVYMGDVIYPMSTFGGCVWASFVIEVLNRSTRRWITRSKFTYCFGYQIKGHEEVKLYSGVKVSHDAIEMQNHGGWNAAVVSGEGVITNPFVGVNGSVKFRFTVQLINPPRVSSDDEEEEEEEE